MDVVYTGAKPEFQEFGPYTYRESDTYSNLTYEGLDNIIGQEELPAVYNYFTQSIAPTDEADFNNTLDTPMYLTN